MPSAFADGRVKLLNCVHRGYLGGAQWRAIWVGEALRAYGVDTTMLFPADGETAYEGVLKARGMPYRRFRLRPLRGARRVLNNIRHLLELPGETLRLARLIRREGFDIIYVNGVTNIVPVLAARLAGLPVVWHWNDMLTPRAYAALVRPLVSEARGGRLVVVSKAVAAYYGLDREATPPLVMLEPAPSSPPEGLATLPFTRVPGEVVVGFVSNILKKKGCDEFVDTIAALRRDGLAVKGVMVGGVMVGWDGYRLQLEARIARLGLRDHVWMVGYRTNVECWMRQFDVLLFPSHTEAAPIVILQAMQVGVPLVVTRVGNLEELTAGLDVPLVAVGDTQAMAQGVRHLLGLSDVARAALVETLRVRIVERHSLEHVVGLHCALYESLLPGRVLR